MKKLLFIVFLFAVVGCSGEPKGVKDGRKAYKAYFAKILKDPNSFVIYEEKVIPILGDKEEKVTAEFVLDYGAKNGFGAMTRETIHFTTIGDQSIVLDGSMIEVDKL